MNAQVVELIPANAPAEVRNVPAVATMLSDAREAEELVAEYIIDCPAMYEAGAVEVRRLATILDKIEEERFKITRPMDEAKKAVMSFFNGPKGRIEASLKTLRGAMLTFKQEEDRKADEVRRAEERRLRDEREAAARVQAEADRVEREAREAREKAERELREQAKAAADAAARAADDIANSEVAEEARRAAEAAAEAERVAHEAAETARLAAEASEEANEAVEIAAIAPSAVAVSAAPKASGIGTRKTWSGEVTDLHALIKYAAGELHQGRDFPSTFLCVDTKVLNNAAKAMQSRLNVPGVRAVATESMSVRRN